MKSPDDMVAIGIDPSLTGTGVVVLKGGKLVEKHLIKSKKGDGGYLSEVERLNTIRDDVMKIITIHNPDIVCMEGLAFMARNTTALVQLAGLNYLIRSAVVEHKDKADWTIVAPSSLKKFITGKGTGQKDLVMLEIYKRYGVSMDDNNVADAYALAMVGTAVVGAHKKTLTRAQKEVVDLVSKQLSHDIA